MTFRSVALFALTLSLSAQTIRPSFEVASVRVTDPKAARGKASGILVTGRNISIAGMPMNQMIRTAYGVQDNLVEGPGWVTPLGNLTYDIEAAMPPGMTASQLPLMLQSLLEERFKLSAHWGTKVGDYYAVVVGKEGAKLTKTPDDPNDFSKFDWGSSTGEKGVKLFQSGSTKTWDEPGGLSRVQMSTLADVAKLLNPHFGGLPVVDKTGIQGTYDIKLQYVLPDYARAKAEGRSTSEFTSDLRAAIRTGVISGVEKLGLRIEKQHGEIDTLVIDHLEKVPTDN
ncbi:MAG: TIGR03435 family protein [Bryobacteraceae bacterium]